MRVRSKLADVDFVIGRLYRKDHRLLIDSDPNQPMKSRVYVEPADVTLFLRKLILSPSAWLFFLGLPWFYFKAKRERTLKPGP